MSEKTFEQYDLRLKTPFTCILAGPTKSGKTTFAFNLLRSRHEVMDVPSDRIFFFYNQWQRSFKSLKEEGVITEWFNYLPTIDQLKELTFPYMEGDGSIVIIDDFMQQINRDVLDLFTVLSHAYHITVLLMSQNIFPDNKLFRSISINATYIVVFKNPRDSSQIQHFASQFSPGDTRWLIESFRECTKGAFTYLMFDFHQKTEQKVRVLSRFLPHEWPMRVWMRKEDATDFGY